jgi:hypothetical protein
MPSYNENEYDPRKAIKTKPIPHRWLEGPEARQAKKKRQAAKKAREERELKRERRREAKLLAKRHALEGAELTRRAAEADAILRGGENFSQRRFRDAQKRYEERKYNAPRRASE